MFFFNPELLLISGVDATNPADPLGWVWITNPIEIAVIFIGAFIGMVAFSCSMMGYFIIKTSLTERILFLIPVPFMFLPKIMQTYMSLPSHYISYFIGIFIIVGIYLVQKARQKKEVKI